MESSTVPEQSSENYVELAADVVSAYVSNNPVPTSELPSLIAAVHASLQFPAVSIKKSVQPDYIVCLEDGKRFKSLKRHLRTKFDMTPEQYRQKWDLPRDYPMVAPNYASRRSELAKALGLGQKRKGKSGKKKAAA
ncbi:MAG: transcriptional regulator [Microvirga sp.]|nr:transcriptional regulator [Microvirga sp.]